MANPYVFIVGCPRSGTTPPQRIVDAHRQLQIAHEQFWIVRYFKERKRLTPEGLVTPDLIASLLQQKRLHKLGVVREGFERLLGSCERVSYASFAIELLHGYGKAKRQGWVGGKCPSQVRELPTLRALWARTSPNWPSRVER